MIVAVAISTSVLLACLLWKGWDLWVLLWQHKKWLWGMVLAPVGLVGLKMLGKQYGPEKGEIPSYRDPEKANGESAAKRNGKMAPPGEGWMQSAGYVLTHLGMWLYHGQSIFWTWRSLTFASVTSYTLKNDLDYVRMRYHDIADAATSGSEDQIRASALSEAFRLLENMEFSLEKAGPPDTGLQDSGISEYE